MLLTAPVADQVADRPVYSDRGYRYWRQLADGRVTLGGWRNTAFDDEVGFDDQPTTAVQARLDAHLRGVLGVDAPVERRWAGTMGFTPDRLPLVGPVPGLPGVFVCAGYSGHGMGFAFEAARLLVDHVVDGSPLPGWLLPNRDAASVPG
jgi:glycine/D-amino acid oxidase-like deaminating enzyme